MKTFFNWIIFFFTKWFKQYQIFIPGQDYWATQFTNTTAEKKQCVLFGVNMFFGEENFGNPKGVEIKQLYEDFSGKGAASYAECLQETGNNPFFISKVRIDFPATDRQFYLTERIVYTEIDANGYMTELPLVPLNSFDLYQFLQNTIDISRFSKNIIHGGSHFAFSLAPNSYLVFGISTLKKISVNYFEYKKHSRENKKRKYDIIPVRGSVFNGFAATKKIFTKLFSKK